MTRLWGARSDRPAAGFTPCGDPTDPEGHVTGPARWADTPVPGCSDCARGNGPYHRPSPRCESGADVHCACDTCF